MKEQKTHQLYIRGVSKQVKNELKKEAKKNGRSLNGEVLFRLNNSLVIQHIQTN